MQSAQYVASVDAGVESRVYRRVASHTHTYVNTDWPIMAMELQLTACNEKDGEDSCAQDGEKEPHFETLHVWTAYHVVQLCTLDRCRMSDLAAHVPREIAGRASRVG